MSGSLPPTLFSSVVDISVVRTRTMDKRNGTKCSGTKRSVVSTNEVNVVGYALLMVLVSLVGCTEGVEGVSTSTLIDKGVIQSWDDLTPGQKEEVFETKDGTVLHPLYSGSLACQAMPAHEKCKD
jgi:hypothetical protein